MCVHAYVLCMLVCVHFLLYVHLNVHKVAVYAHKVSSLSNHSLPEGHSGYTVVSTALRRRAQVRSTASAPQGKGP